MFFENDEIALPVASQRHATARIFTENPDLMAAAVYIGEKVYKTPYTEPYSLISTFNFTYTCSDGTVINRPNHNMANIMRSLYYLQHILEYLRLNGNDDAQNLLAMLTGENEIQKILFLLLFYTSGRTNEVGFSQNPNIAKQQRANAEQNFKEYFATDPSAKTPFKNMQEVEHYASLLRDCYGVFNNQTKAEPKDKAICSILVLCHSLDFFRCFAGHNLQHGTIDKFNKFSKSPNNRNLQKLFLYAQRCIVATGDMLRTQYQTQEIPGVYEQTSFFFRLKEVKRKLTHAGNNWFTFLAKKRDDALFKAASRVDQEGIKKTSEVLSQVVTPIFFAGNPINMAYNETEILNIIENGDAAIRGFNAIPSDMSLRFEVEQLVSPEYLRPLKKNKLKRRHDIKVNLKTGITTQLPERVYHSVDKQKRVTCPQDYTSSQYVSRQEDRGKPKNTVYQKKCSYSLVPKSGIFSIFHGRRKEKIFNFIFGNRVSVGFLHDVKKMNLKGEKYIWSIDAATDESFWLAKEDGAKQVCTALFRQKSRDLSHLDSIEELKEKINDLSSGINFNEFLGSGSIDSLVAICVSSNDEKHILAALYVQCVLRSDYGIERNIVIMHRKNKPIVMKKNELEQFWIKVNNELQHGWIYWFKSIFYQPVVKKIVMAINSATNNAPFCDASHVGELVATEDLPGKITSEIKIAAWQGKLPGSNTDVVVGDGQNKHTPGASSTS